jgi:DNA-binding sugar fermentation-stimulating protein
VVLFIAALPGIGGFMPNEPADPALRLLLKQAAAAGVELRAIGLCFDPPSSCVMLYARDLEVDLGGTASP